MLSCHVCIQVIQCSPHFIGMFLGGAKDDGLPETIGAFHKIGKVARNRLCPRPERYEPFKVLGAVLSIRNLAAIPIHLSLARLPDRSHQHR
jgi:hypothetical protein